MFLVFGTTACIARTILKIVLLLFLNTASTWIFTNDCLHSHVRQYQLFSCFQEVKYTCAQHFWQYQLAIYCEKVYLPAIWNSLYVFPIVWGQIGTQRGQGYHLVSITTAVLQGPGLKLGSKHWRVSHAAPTFGPENAFDHHSSYDSFIQLELQASTALSLPSLLYQ